jgi:hypothetical protein
VIDGEVKPPSKEEKDKTSAKRPTRQGGDKPFKPRDNDRASKPRDSDKSFKPREGRDKPRPDRPNVIKEEEAEEAPMEVQEEEEEEEERGWTIGQSKETTALTRVKPRRDEEDYDLGRVFASVRGRGGGRMGGRGRGRGRG